MIAAIDCFVKVPIFSKFFNVFSWAFQTDDSRTSPATRTVAKTGFKVQIFRENTISEQVRQVFSYYFDYEGVEGGWSKVEGRWRKDGGNFT